MRTFEVYLNRRRLCLAGIGNDGVLTAIANLVVGKEGRDMWLSIGGLISPSNEQVLWPDRILRVGDVIKIKICETTSADKPATRIRHDPGKELKDQKKYVRRLAKQLGWKIQVKASK